MTHNRTLPLREACPVCGRTMPHVTYPSEDVEPHRWPALASEPTQDDSPLRSALERLTEKWMSEANTIDLQAMTDPSTNTGSRRSRQATLFECAQALRSALASEPTPREEPERYPCGARHQGDECPYCAGSGWTLFAPVQPAPDGEAARDYDAIAKSGTLGKYLRAEQLAEIADRDGRYKARIAVLEAAIRSAPSGGLTRQDVYDALPEDADDALYEIADRIYAALASPSPDPEP